MQTFLTLYVISLPVFVVIDLLWIGVIASDFYRSRVGYLMEINWTAAVAFYLIFLLGMTFFVLYPAVSEGWRMAALLGGAYGFFTYASYNLTNLATLRDWSTSLALGDMAWGTVFGASIAGITVALYTLFN